jgi:hypothetical protein
MMNARGPVTGSEMARPGTSTRWVHWINLILGAILFISPWYSVTWSNTTSSWNAWITGILIMLGAIWVLATTAPVFVSGIHALLGIWVFIAPWVLRFASTSNAEAWSHWIIGALVFLLAAWVLIQSRIPSPRPTV